MSQWPRVKVSDTGNSYTFFEKPTQWREWRVLVILCDVPWRFYCFFLCRHTVCGDTDLKCGAAHGQILQS